MKRLSSLLRFIICMNQVATEENKIQIEDRSTVYIFKLIAFKYDSYGFTRPYFLIIDLYSSGLGDVESQEDALP